MPPPLYAARCGPAPAYPRLACGAHLALLPIAVGAMNIHDVRDRRQTDGQTDVRQKHRLMPPPIRGGGIIIFEYQVR